MRNVSQTLAEVNVGDSEDEDEEGIDDGRNEFHVIPVNRAK